MLARVQAELDRVLAERLREALQPLLERSAQALLEAARAQIDGTLHEAVARALADELARRAAPAAP